MCNAWYCGADPCDEGAHEWVESEARRAAEDPMYYRCEIEGCDRWLPCRRHREEQ